MPPTTPNISNATNQNGAVFAYLSMNQPIAPKKMTVAASSMPVFRSGASSRSASDLPCGAVVLEDGSAITFNAAKGYKRGAMLFAVVKTYRVKRRNYKSIQS